MKINAQSGVEVKLGVDYLQNKAELDAMADKVVYTGPIDAYFDDQLGYLEYRSVRFENEVLEQPNFQGNAAVNYTDRETPWTRIIEHKWFELISLAAGIIVYWMSEVENKKYRKEDKGERKLVQTI